jgi:hypothetical protein
MVIFRRICVNFILTHQKYSNGAFTDPLLIFQLNISILEVDYLLFQITQVLVILETRLKG